MAGLGSVFDLRKEEDVREYLKNINIEYRYQCLHEKLPEGCHRLADFFEAFKKDDKEARKIFQKNCDDNNYGHSCFKLALFNMAGRGGPKDRKQAYQYYLKGCDDGYIPSCHNAALMHDVGYLAKDKAERDYGKATELLKHACAKGYAPSCNLVSSYFLSGKKSVDKDMKQAFKFADEACRMGHMYACANVSIMYKKGDGVEKDMKRSKEYEMKAKELHKEATTGEKTIKMSE